LDPQDFHLIFTTGSSLRTGTTRLIWQLLSSANKRVFRFIKRFKRLIEPAPFPAHAEAEEFKLDKRSLGGSCEER